jgi:hypothetical protein
VLTFFIVIISNKVVAKDSISNEEAVYACVTELSRHVKDDVTIGYLNKQCYKKIQNTIEKRKELEKIA